MKKFTKNGIPAGNWEDKYNTQNPVSKFLVKNFIRTVKNLVLKNSSEINSITDIGCGEGYVTSIINSLNIAPVRACDFSEEVINSAKSTYGTEDIDFYVKDVIDVDENESADLILCLEVLEHIGNPESVLEKLSKITRQYCLLSVPDEPLWRILNIARGKYISDSGNTPGHIQHWTSREFHRLVSKYFHVIEAKSPLPWTVLLCKK